MQQELDLIIAHRATSEEVSNLQLHILYASDSQKDEYEKLLLVHKEDLRKIEEALLASEDRSGSQLKREALLNVMNHLIAGLRPNGAGNPVSRKQGMVLHNYIYAKIMYDIKRTFEGDYGSAAISDFYYRVGGTFEASPLIDFLKEKYNELSTLAKVDYLTLSAYVKGLLEDIRQMRLEDKGYED